MNLFNIGNIVSKFNKLQKEVDSYIEGQRSKITKLEQEVESARVDQATALSISNALRNINKGE